MTQAYGYSNGNVIILVGPPGSGKGTQAALLSPALGIPTISTGEMLRRECKSGSDLGSSVQAILDSGQLVSDALMNQVISSRLREADCQRGFILDGYPRTVSQARFLARLLTAVSMPHPVAFHFDISNEDVVSRLTRRLQCAECGRIFSMNSNLINGDSPDGEMLCDRDGSKLVHRADDNAASVRERLRLYEENASRLAGYYRNHRYHRICANRAPQEISSELLTILPSHSSAPIVPGRARAANQLSYSV
ncbi:MAG: adenylate kinase family protein [Bryobacteraceae bacterium]